MRAVDLDCKIHGPHLCREVKKTSNKECTENVIKPSTGKVPAMGI